MGVNLVIPGDSTIGISRKRPVSTDHTVQYFSFIRLRDPKFQPDYKKRPFGSGPLKPEKALLYYSHNRGGFGWDDKTAGYQVLMAQLTADGTFTSDVRNYFNYLENQAPRTPKGILFSPYDNLK